VKNTEPSKIPIYIVILQEDDWMKKHTGKGTLDMESGSLLMLDMESGSFLLFPLLR
jgi:hypothetical protein